LLTGILMLVIVGIAIAYFALGRQQHHQYLRDRARIHARYCSEYAVARYGVPTFISDPEHYDQGQDENNWLYPVRASQILDNDFQDEDTGYSFRFGYDSLKMDKIYDLASSRPFCFVSAEGVVSWSDREGEHQLRHRSALGLCFGDFSRFMYFSNFEASPEGAMAFFGEGEEIFGRVHVNGRINIGIDCCPVFHGLVSQTEREVHGISEDQIPFVFRGGLMKPSLRIDWPPHEAFERIKERRGALHTYKAYLLLDDSFEQPLTTYLKFDGGHYHVAQYWSDSLDAEGDTIYQPILGREWLRRALPRRIGHELIWVKGVCRLEGIVTGRVTVLSSDSMFIMDNIITSDIILPCGDYLHFGTVPPGSPNRIGLVSEKDIIVAATLPNGAFNGRFNGPDAASWTIRISTPAARSAGT